METSTTHLGFTKDIDGIDREVFHAGGRTWREVVWAPLSSPLDVISGLRGSARPAPFDVVKQFATDFPWK